jgi:dipeptidyl aminopeptidase/acylaminoacyl peptidase
MTMLRAALLALVLLSSVSYAGEAVLQQALSYENFAQLPDASRLTLSPGGKKLAATVRVDVPGSKGMAVQVTEVASKKQEIVLFTDNSKYFINWIRWKDDRTLLVGTYFPAQRDTWTGMSQVRYKTREGRLLIIDTDSGEVTSPFKKAFLEKFGVLPTWLSSVVDTLPNDPEHILMALPGQNSSWSRMIYKVNIKNQRTQVEQRPEPNVRDWYTDRQHRVRLGRHVDDGIVTLRVKDIDSGDWRDLWSYEIFSEDEVDPMGFGYDPNILYIRAYHNGLKAAFKVDLKDKDLKRELVYADPKYDVFGSLVYDAAGKRVVGIGGSHDGGTVFFDEDLKSLQDGIDSALPHARNFIYSLTDDLQNFLVYSTGHTESGTYYVGGRNPSSLAAAAYRYDKLMPGVLSPVEEYHYKARDGLDIQAWLTKPIGQKGKLPTLMFPHGGPHSRDSAAFDYWAQFFASKGYAVLQMNFRGSQGHGHAFFKAGLQNWGKEMQDDVQDGALALIADGIADPDKICIVGASYGGYAALMGAAKTPDFYRCSISFAGVSNVFDLVRDNRAFWASYNVVDAQIGKLGSDLKDISPVNHAEKFKVPVLLIHGDSDRQVEPKHSHQMRDALEKHGKKVTYIELPAEDHYLSNEDNRLITFKAMNDFLDEHLPVK